MADENTNDGGYRNGNHQAEKTEKNAAGQQGKHNPDRMQSDAVPNQFGSQEIAFKELSDKEDADNLLDGSLAVKLCLGYGNADNKAADAADIRDERNQACQEANQQPQFKSRKV